MFDGDPEFRQAKINRDLLNVMEQWLDKRQTKKQVHFSAIQAIRTYEEMQYT